MVQNVLAERRCPDQIIFGSMDPENCMQLGMALYLEQYLDRFPDADYLFTEASNTVVQDDDGNDKRIYAGDRLIDQFHRRLEDDVWAQAVFKELAPPHEELEVLALTPTGNTRQIVPAKLETLQSLLRSEGAGRAKAAE